ncbi:hypothetical protein N7G274_001655 [Stereocaulon virgatum]|uniref:Uncharacterized protein n=1 Tax=Stereocaulon virgatum TaxID=373712 RepID=A0ABR4ARV6_9LECA
MPKIAVQQSNEGISRLMEFASFLGAACGSVGAVVLPRKLFTAVKDLRPTIEEITAIVQAIDLAESPLCQRLDREGLVVLCRVLSRSQPCLAQQRGLYLIAEALYHDHSDTTVEVAAKAGKKNLLGKHALGALINGFIDVRAPEENRQWMGVLALELLQGCLENTTRLQQSGIINVRALSEVIKHGRCQVLKLLAGSIIRIMLHHGLSPEELWPNKADQELYTHFPRSCHHDTSWILAFEEFVDELVLGGVLTQERSDVLFAYALSIGNTTYNTEDESAILVTIAEALKIIVSASPTDSAKYIVMPLENVRQVNLQSQLSEQSQTSSCALIIHLAPMTEHTYYLNAVGQNDQRILLAFMSETHANTIKDTLLRSQHHLVAASQSQQPVSFSKSDQDCGLAGPDLAFTGDQGVYETTSQAASDNGRRLLSTTMPAAMSTPAAAFRVSTRQLSVSGTSLRPDDAEEMEWAAATIFRAMEGIPVGLSSDVMDPRTGSELQQPAINSAEAASLRPPTQDGPSKSLGIVSNSGLPSSMSGQAGLSAIENAPELVSLTRTHPEQDSRQITPPEDPGYDSSYDISPRLAKDTSQEMINQTPPLPPLPQASQIRTGTSSRSDIGNGNLQKAPHHNVRKSFRSDDGKIEIRAKSLPSMGRESSNRLNLKSATKHTVEGSKAALDARDTRDFHKPQPTKKATLTKNFVNNVLVENEAEGNEFDLPESPEQPNPKATATPSRAKVQGRNRDVPGPDTTKISKKAAPTPQIAITTKSVLTSKASKHGLVRRTKPTKLMDIEEEDETNWDPDLELSDDNRGMRPRTVTKAKATGKQPAESDKVHKPIKAKPKVKRSDASATARAAAKPKAILTTPNKPRPRRAAANKANQRIMEMDDLDEILDDEEDLSLAKPQKKLIIDTTQAARALQVQQLKAEFDDRTPPLTKESQAGRKTATKFTAPVEAAKATTQVEPGLDIEDLDEVNLVGIAPQVTKKAGITPAVLFPQIEKDSILRIEGTSSEYGDPGANHDISPICDKDIHKKSAQQANKSFVSKSVPGMLGELQMDYCVVTAQPIIEDEHDVAPVQMIGDADDSHFQEALPDTEHTYQEEAEISASQSQSTMKRDIRKDGTAAMYNHDKDGRSVRSLKPASDSSQYRMDTTTSGARDPFAAKLKFLAHESEQAHSGVQKVAGPRIADIAECSEQARASAAQPVRATATRKTGYMAKIRQTVQAEEHNDIENIESRQKIDQQAVARKTSMQDSQAQQKANGSGKSDKPNMQSKVEKIPVHRPKRNDDTSKSEKDVSGLPGIVVGNERETSDDERSKQKSGQLTSIKQGVKPTHNSVQGNMKHTVTEHSGTGARTDLKLQTPVPEPSRKPEIISFSAEGPLNQGKVWTQQAKPNKQPQAKKREIPAIATKVVETVKGETAPSMDDLTPWENESLAKRHKRDTTTTPATQKHIARIMPEPEPVSVKDRPHRLGSQSTKVNENGSPIPMARPEFESPAAPNNTSRFRNITGTIDSAQHGGDDDQYMMQNDSYHRDEITLPFPGKKTVPERDNVGFTGLPNNNKQVPSSPHAASTFTTMPAHHIYQNGHIVNAETTERIIPKELHDPFVGGRIDQTSSFIETLRKLSDQDLQRLRNGPKEHMPAVGLIKRSPLHNIDPETTLVEADSVHRKRNKRNFDPEKTLVEPGPVYKKRKHQLSSSSTSSSDSVSSEDESPSQEMTPRQSDTEALAIWYKTLEPHQGNILDVLSNISHRLVKHLVSKGTAIKDIVKDYSTEGNNLVSAYERSRQETLKINKESSDQLRHQLRTSFGKLQAGLTKTSKEMRRRRISDMEKQWMEQQRLMAAVKAAIDACDD